VARHNAKFLMNKKEALKEKIQVREMETDLKSLSATDKQELLRLKCRTDILTFARYITSEVPIAGKFIPFKVHNVIGDFLQRIGDGEEAHKQSAISLPPRTGKSLMISKIFPAWQMGRSPTAQFIMSSYALQLTNENSRAVIEYISHEQFKWIFPECEIDRDKCNLSAIRNGNGGLIKIASAGGSVTGFGFGVISDEDLPGVGILDDLLADGNSATIMETTFAWTQTQFLTRGLPNHAIISMGTRFHVDDVIGRLLKANPDDWRELNVPALCIDEENDVLDRKLGESHWPEFFPLQNLVTIKKSIGDKDFNALYLGRPAGEQGAIFKEMWFDYHSKNLGKYSYVYATVDPAYKAERANDYTAICIWGYDRSNTKLHLIHYVLERIEFPEMEKLLPQLIKQWKIRAVYIEGRAAGMPLIQTLRRTANISIKELVPNKDKVLRANAIAPIVESKVVSLYENLPQLPERLSELTSFPFIKNDDFVDAFTYGVTVYRDEIMGGRPVHGGERGRLPRMVHDPSFQGGSRRISSDIGLIGANRGASSTTTKYL
jgi:predicted phage terminase large subunit-like protein